MQSMLESAPAGSHPVSAPPADWQAQLDQFRATRQPRARRIAGHDWELIRAGAGAEALLLLPGGLAVAETAFRSICHFENRYVTLAITYPETIHRLDELISGLLGLLDAEGLATVSVVGGSYSGLVAQALLRAAPERIARIALSDTGVPRPERARRSAWSRPLVARLPVPLLRLLWRLSVAAFLRPMAGNRDFWRRYFNQRISAMRRAAWLSHLDIWLEFDRTQRFAPGDLAGWRGRMLLIEAERDGLFGPAEQRRLRELYPAATVRTFADSPHCASLARMDDYIAAIDAFLEEQP
ncbi:MAG TPA: alpha/beta hydrolase [Herpetosiphonaceae bacterium]